MTLPRATRARLDRIADTGSLGRRPTAAHPDCVCGQRGPCDRCHVPAEEPCTHDNSGIIYERHHPDGTVSEMEYRLPHHRPARCPVHAPDATEQEEP